MGIIVVSREIENNACAKSQILGDVQMVVIYMQQICFSAQFVILLLFNEMLISIYEKFFCQNRAYLARVTTST